MANTLNSTSAKKKYRLLITHDNNYCSMPTYFYNSQSGSLVAFSDDTDFFLKDKSRSIVSHLAMLERQKNAGLQDNVDVLSVSLAQTIFPREENTFLSGTIKRGSYLFPWRDDAANRYNKVYSSELDSNTINFQNSGPSFLFSYWSMDASSSFVGGYIKQGELMYKSTYSGYTIYPLLHARFGRFLISKTTPDNSVHTQAGKGPFPDSYDQFVQDIKLIYKDYTVLPEYNISEKVRDAVISGSGVYADDFNTLSLRGTSSYSSNDLFLEQHVHSDHIDSKEYIENSFSNFSLKNIRISVNGVKKLLPYDGFYPQQRSLQLSTLFSQSYAPSTLLQGSQKTFRTATTHLFSRGLYNSIRAGIACDIPMFSSFSARTVTGITYDRVPFEAIVEPNSYMSRGYKIYEYEPIEDSSPLTTTIESTASLGQSDGIYEMAMNNFIAETPNFFLNSSGLSSLKSLPNDQWKFDFGKYSSFTMNVILSKDDNFTNHDAFSYYGYPHNYYVPPYFSLTGSGGQNYWDFSTYYDENVPPTASWKSNRAIATITFDASSWANSLTNVSTIVTPTFEDIKTYSTVTYTNENLQSFYPEAIVSGAFMPLSSSMNLFDSPDNKNIWNIHTKWECPVHNFVGVTTYNSASAVGGDGTPAGDIHRGIWHQYSTNTVSGLNLSLEYSSSNANRTVGSLIDACGFDIEPKKIGNLTDRKLISEYVVVIPYTVDECQIEKYFKLPLEQFESEYARTEQKENDNSIRDLIRKSRKCVLPPRLNFVSYRDRINKKILDEGEYSNTLPPFAMYIFEFTSTLTRQDLSNIWQGVSPSLTDISEFQKLEIDHAIAPTEVLNPQNLEAFDGKLPNNVRFKVFKAKAKALTSYKQLKQKTIGEEISPSKTLSYNWPYDYFSLVEMAKVDVDLSFEDGE